MARAESIADSRPIPPTPPCEMPDEYGSRCRHWRYCRNTGHECRAIAWYYDDQWRTRRDRLPPEEVAAMRPTSIHEMTEGAD